MDFFDEQDQARRRSGRLVLLFVLAVLSIVALLYLTAMTAIHFAEGHGVMRWWDPQVFLLTVGTGLVVITLGSLFRVLSLGGGGKSVAEMMGGRLLSASTRDAGERQLLNVVEEMALASGLPVPPVYLMDEQGINAFAAGYRPENAVIGVTRGALEQLSRDELQGVIAHEFSHIMHGDMRLNIRLMGLLYGILMISMIGAIMMRSLYFSGGRRSSRGNNNGHILLAIFATGLVAYIIGYIGVIFGGMIKAAVSRQREFLADASAVQYTRNPDGIGGALKKLAGFHSKIKHPNAGEASHFFFGEISSLSSLMATHPPLKERIKRIDPQFNQELKNALEQGGELHAGASGFAGGSAAAPAAGQAGAGDFSGISAAAMLSSIGDPGASHLAYSRALLEHMSEELHDATHDPYLARGIIYCLLLDEDPAIAERQWQRIDEFAESDVVSAAKRLRDDVAVMERHARLPLLELCLPTLGQLTKKQAKNFLFVVDALIEADDEVTAFEYALRHHLRIAIDPDFAATSGGKATVEDAQFLLRVVAHVGAPDDPAAAGQAFTRASSKLKIAEAHKQQMQDREIDWLHFDEALLRLSEISPGEKRKLINAAVTAVAADDRVTSDEADVLRTLGAALGCPIPPLVSGRLQA